VAIATLAALALAALAATALVAQEAPRQLTLAEAIRTARENNPNFLSTRNDQAAADWGVRQAYGAFLPTASARGAMSYTEAGVQRIGTLDFGAQSTDWYSSSYSLSLNWSLDGNTLFGVSNARASQRATAARIDAAQFTLESAVTLQYMAALRSRDAVEVAQRQLDRAEQNLELVENRVDAGAAAGTEGKQAAVDRGRAEVGLIQAEQALRAQKLLLMEQLGVSMDEGVELVSAFEVFEPTWSRDELLSYALADHPSLVAFQASERASRAGARQARSSYFPSVNLSTSFSGNTLQALNDDFLVSQAASGLASSYNSCRRWQIIQDNVGQPLPGLDFSDGCGSPELSSAQRDAVLASNEVFPFDFTKNPLSLTLSVSVPVFTGFSRQRQVEQAEAAADDARHARRAEELRLRTAVTQAYNDLVAAHRVVEIEGRNRELAAERLEMARQRYAIGAGPSQGSGVVGSTFLELLDALASMSTAERDYLDATYDFHLALAQLEAATGRTLRPAGTGSDEQGAASEGV
jgi:outer membrane protein